MAATSSSSGGASGAGGALTSGSPLSSSMNRIVHLLRTGRRCLSTNASTGDPGRRTSDRKLAVRGAGGAGTAVGPAVAVRLRHGRHRGGGGDGPHHADEGRGP